jgi:hypothetical protein
VDGIGFLRQRGGGRLVLSIGGYAFAAVVLVEMARFYGWPGDDAYIWSRAGGDLLAGRSPYAPMIPGGFYFAPPWAIAFAAISWLPVPVIAAGILALEVLALRYVAGSWLRAGWLCWLPIVPLELVGSQWNLVMAAAIAAAVRGEARPAMIMAAAKLAPALAIDPRAWRRVLPVGVALVAITLPWLWLWPDWIHQLTSVWSVNLAPGAQLLIPLGPRLAVAAVLVVAGWRWTPARGLAAIVATPALYWVSGVLFFALLPPSGPRRADSS